MSIFVHRPERRVCSALCHIVDSQRWRHFSKFSNLQGPIMNYTEAINIPVMLNEGNIIASSLLPALCWRHNTLKAGLFTWVTSRDKWHNTYYIQRKYLKHLTYVMWTYGMVTPMLFWESSSLKDGNTVKLWPSVALHWGSWGQDRYGKAWQLYKWGSGSLELGGYLWRSTSQKAWRPSEECRTDRMPHLGLPNISRTSLPAFCPHSITAAA